MNPAQHCCCRQAVLDGAPSASGANHAGETQPADMNNAFTRMADVLDAAAKNEPNKNTADLMHTIAELFRKAGAEKAGNGRETGGPNPATPTGDAQTVSNTGDANPASPTGNATPADKNNALYRNAFAKIAAVLRNEAKNEAQTAEMMNEIADAFDPQGADSTREADGNRQPDGTQYV